MSRRGARPRGAVGVQSWTFPTTPVSGLPLPWLGVAPAGGTSGLNEVDRSGRMLHVPFNGITHFAPLYNPWPGGIDQIGAAGYSQQMTIEPTTGMVNISGGVRQSDGVIDSPVVVGTTYTGFVTSGAPTLAGNVTQPVDSVISGGNIGNKPLERSLTAITSATASGTTISCTPFTPNYVWTAMFFTDIVGLIAGAYDSIFQAWAVSAAGKGVMVRFAHEMNGDWYPWGVGAITPAQYRSLWAKVRSVWQTAETAGSLAHVPWVWCANASNNLSNVVADSEVLSTGAGQGSQFPLIAPPTIGTAGGQSCYPGDDQCEFVSLDTYAYPGSWAGSRASVERMFNANFQFIRQRITNTKPLLISEMGCDASIGGADRSQWIRDAFTYLKAHPEIRGIGYWNHGVQNAQSTGYGFDGFGLEQTAWLEGVQRWIGQ